MKKTILFILVVYLLSNFAFAENIKIPAAFALTGAASAFGVNELHGATLAVEELNAANNKTSTKFELKVEDTQSSNIGTVNAISKLIYLDRPKFILGPTWLDSFQGAVPIADKKSVLLLTPSAVITNIKSDSSKYKYTFSTYINFKVEVRNLISKIRSDQKSKIAIIVDQDPYSLGLRNFCLEFLKEDGKKVLIDESFVQGTTYF